MRSGQFVALVVGGLAAAGLGLANAQAQLMTVTAQERFIEGQTASTNPDGSMFSVGPDRVDAPAGDFSTWFGTLAVGGNVSVNGVQTGGWDGMNTITLDAYSMSLAGGGPPMSGGTSSLRNVFSYTFTLSGPATYTANASFGCGLDVALRLSLTGPGGSTPIDVTAIPNGPLSELHDETGNLAAGTYTLTLRGEGTISYDGGTTGGGNGSGAGGANPNLVFTVAPRACAGDFNNSGAVSVQDIFDFLSAYFANDPRADINQSGAVSVQDIFDFLSAYFAGCN